MNNIIFYVKKVLFYFILLSIFSVLLFRFVPPPATPLMGIRLVHQWTLGKQVVLKKNWKSIDKISGHIQRAMVAAEDQEFLEHFGFDFHAIKSAFKNNSKKSHHCIRGGSTITQQVAKNLFLWPGRSYLRKILEAYFTLLIELLWSKERVMEMYLNIIEFGEGIYGVEAAADTFFHVSSFKITPSQAALLASIVPNPLKWSPVHPSKYVIKRQYWVMGQMRYFKQLKYRE